MPSLAELGFGPDFQAALEALRDPSLVPARVATEHPDRYLLLTADGPVEGVVAGRLRFEAEGPGALPATGDWVAVRPTRPARIVKLLPRRSALLRQAAGMRTGAQVLAANVDLVLVVTAAGGDFNLRRVERYLAAVHGSGAAAVVVLNKADLAAEPEALLAQLATAAPGVEVLLTSALDGTGLEAVYARLAPGSTVALVGSSGVGKSSLINRLLGEERLAVGEVREADDRGRHTTAGRQLFLVPLPGGGSAVLMDTPGLRELQLWAEGASLEGAFADIAALAVGCRFDDCTHAHEPGCAVRAAVERGELDPARVDSLHKLGREQARQAMRQDVHARLEGRRREKELARRVRELGRVHPKRRG